jgi:hypothetical protein
MLFFKVIDIDLIWISSVANTSLFYLSYKIILIKAQDYSKEKQLFKVSEVLQQKRLPVFGERKLENVLQMTCGAGFF